MTFFKNTSRNVRKYSFCYVRPAKDSYQTARMRSLNKVFVVRLKKHCILDYPKCAQWRFWTICANIQADLNLSWAHMSEGVSWRCCCDVFSTTQLAFYVNLHRAVIGPSATLTGRWRPDIDLRRMLTGYTITYTETSYVSTLRLLNPLYTE